MTATTGQQTIIRTAELDNTDWYHILRLSYLANGKETNHAYTLFEALGRPGGEPPPHVHSQEDELFWILEGEVTFWAGDQMFQGRAGSLAYLPRGVPHGFKIVSERGRVLVMLTPSGFERFFKSFSVPAQHMGMPPDLEGELDIPRFLALGQEMGLEFLPPGTMPADYPAKPGSRKPVLLAPGEGEKLSVLGTVATVKLTGEETGGAFSMFETLDPPQGGTPLHFHRNEEEAFYVLEGDYLFQNESETICAKPGTFAYIPRGARHAYKNVGTTPGRLLVLTTPSGYENFFRAVDALTTSWAEPSALMAAAARYGVEIVGPPIGGE